MLKWKHYPQIFHVTSYLKVLVQLLETRQSQKYLQQIKAYSALI